MGRYIRTIAFGFSLVVAAMAAGADALASPQSEALIKAGIAKLQKLDFGAALTDFDAAIAADPADGRALYYQGFALNRLGQHGGAFAGFQQMRLKGTTHPELDYEQGWAALATGRFNTAVVILEPYEKRRTDNGKASEFLGRAYLGLGRLDDAEAALKRAIQRDVNTASTSYFYLAEIEAMRGQKDRSRQAINQLLQTAPNTPVGNALRSLAQAQPATPGKDAKPPKPWSAYAGLAVGYNSNVISLSDSIVRPQDIRDTGSPSYQIDVGGQYRFDLTAASALSVGYALSYVNFPEMGRQDLFDQGLFARYEHRLADIWMPSFQISGSHGRVDGDTFLNSVSFRPALAVQPTESLALEIYYSRNYADYNDPNQTPQFLNRDSWQNVYGGRISAKMAPLRTMGEVGIAHIDNNSEGSDFDYSALQAHVSLATSWPWQITSLAQVKFTGYHYDHRNSMAPTSPPSAVAFGHAREDFAVQTLAKVSRPIWGAVDGYAQYQFTDNNSNIAVYNFHQHDVRVGVVARF